MKRPRNFPVYFAATALLVAWVAAPALAQQNQNSSSAIIDDWTHHHVIFSNPGTLQDAVSNGTQDKWQRVVADPRYRMQVIKRNATAFVPVTNLFGSGEDSALAFHRRNKGLWTIPLGAGGASPAVDMYPAKYTFAPIGTPSCTSDFVVFPVSIAGAVNSQANIVGVNNLYTTTCSGTVPSYEFSYYIGTGTVRTSPVLSLDGTEIAFVESVSGGSNFHVLTIGTTGTNVGSSSGAPVTPGSGNNAVDNKVKMSGSVMVTRSSPFVDYAHDIAYIGDDTGTLHKFTPVFKGTPAEVTTGGWPFTVGSGVILSGPTYDSVSGNIFVGGSGGSLYCVTSTGTACATPSVTVGTGPILDAPIVDSTNETVFTEANTASNAILSQVTTAMVNQVSATMGASGTDLYDGAFDNAYFTSVSTGHMYFCGNLTSAATPELLRVTFNSSGTMSSANDGKSFQLVVSGDTGTGYDCTPLTEIYNAGEGHDYLFVGVKNGGFNTGTPNCSTTTCIIGFDLAAAFPTIEATTMTLSPGGTGISGIIIDNVSTTTGASQVYFGNIAAGRGEQASQATLK